MPADEENTTVVRVILPTHNRADVLGDAIQNALGQTHGDLELVIVDDGSTDATPDLMADWARRDRRVRCLRQQQGGASAARNAGLALPDIPAVVAFLDSDDVWSADHLATSVRVLNECPDVGLVFARYDTVDNADKMTPEGMQARARRMDQAFALGERALPGGAVLLSAETSLSAMLLSDISPATPSVVLRTPPEPLRFFDLGQEILEDALYFIRLADSGVNFAYFNDVHVRVRYFGDNLTARLGLESPVKLRRLRSTYEFTRKKLAYARRENERQAIRQNIADIAYLVGQSAAEQGDLRGARAAYRTSLAHCKDWRSAKGLLGASLPPRMRRMTKRLLGGDSAPDGSRG
jgi:glycosyltransferase involved in cell wall biosynthesis